MGARASLTCPMTTDLERVTASLRSSLASAAKLILARKYPSSAPIRIPIMRMPIS